MAEAIASLINEWNHYYLGFSLKSLADCISAHLAVIEAYRGRDIRSLCADDGPQIRMLYIEFRIAMERLKDGSTGYVSTSQALHLLCPAFFGMWNRKIAKIFPTTYPSPTDNRELYDRFCERMAVAAERLGGFTQPNDPKTLLKRVHEFQWSVSQGWILW